MEQDPSAFAAVRIALLGPPAVEIDAQSHTIVRRQTRALLYYLAAAPEAVSRDQLCLLLWPDVSDSTARRNLSVQLNLLRRALPAGLLQTTSTALGLHAERSWSDVAAFRAASRSSAARDLEQAVALYRGPFLDGFALAASDEFDAWVSQERHVWERRYLETLAALVEALTVGQRYQAAVEYARRYLTTDPLAEEMHRRLIALYAAAGDRSAALRQFERCAVALERELGVSPMAETRAVYEAIRAGKILLAGTPHVEPPLEIQPPTAAPRPEQPGVPLPATALIGRAAELATCSALLRLPDVRLLTLTGAGGSGKTELALHLATALRPEFAQGALLVELAPLQRPDQVIGAIAQACGLLDAGDRPLREVVRDYVATKELLLVLDNFEHLLGAAPTIAALLAHAPGLRVLATSRAALNVSGEQLFPVPPLPLPPLDPLPPLEDLAARPAVALLVTRVRAVNPAFALTAANAPALAAICVRLDGLPLAIELAAVRLRLLAPQALLRRLDHRLALLTSGPRDLPQRHQTLRATIDWSYRLLDLGTQLLFERLAVFTGSWTLDAAEQVCGGIGPLTVDVLDGLHDLVDKQLVGHALAADGEMRFGMLQTIHEFAAERLAARGAAEQARRLHAIYYCGLAEQAAPRLRSPEQAVWLAQLDDAYPNIVAAVEWAAAHDAACGLRLAGALRSYWIMRSYLREGRRIAERALGVAGEGAAPIDDSVRLLAAAANCAGELAFLQGDYAAARRYLDDSVVRWQQLGREREYALALLLRASAAELAGDRAAAIEDQATSAALIERLGDPEGQMVLSYGRARDALHRGDPAGARRWYEAAIAMSDELGDAWWRAALLLELGPVLLALGDADGARAHLADGLRLAERQRHTLSAALALNNLGEIARSTGDDEHAERYYEDCLARLEDLGNQADLPRVLHNLGYVALHHGDHERAARLFRDSLRRFVAQHSERGTAEALAGLASVAAAHDPEHAARLWGAAELLRERAAAALWPADQPEHARYGAVARANIAPERFAAAWRAGRLLEIEQAVAAALGQ